MNAKKCDRCKNYYDKNYNNRKIEGYPVTGIRIVAERPSGAAARIVKIDLCDCCVEKLYGFFETSLSNVYDMKGDN